MVVGEESGGGEAGEEMVGRWRELVIGTFSGEMDDQDEAFLLWATEPPCRYQAGPFVQTTRHSCYLLPSWFADIAYSDGLCTAIELIELIMYLEQSINKFA
jgi:hypothetical protein